MLPTKQLWNELQYININPFTPEFLKWSLSSPNLYTSILANWDFSQKSITEWQTVQILMWWLKMSHFIWIFTGCKNIWISLQGLKSLSMHQILYLPWVVGQTGLSKQCRQSSDTTECSVWSRSTVCHSSSSLQIHKKGCKIFCLS